MDFSAIDVSASGMRAQRMRMELVAANLANLETTSARREIRRAEDGTPYVRHVPYRRRRAVFEADPAGRGVAVRAVEDASPFRAEHDPAHPHAVPADSDGEDAGIVYYPNVHPLVEMVEMIAASRAYEANVAAADAFKAMMASTLRILA